MGDPRLGVKWSVLKVSTAKTGRQSLYDTAVYYLKWSVLKVSTGYSAGDINTFQPKSFTKKHFTYRTWPNRACR